MNETGDEKSERQLIDDTHRQKIMANTITTTRWTKKSDQREEIVRQSQDEKKKRGEKEESNCCLSLIVKKIRGEELIESKRERFSIELTFSTWMTCRTKTNEIIREMKIAF